MLPLRARLGERGRLTALYAGLLVLTGAALITVVFLVVRSGLDERIGNAVTKTIVLPPSAVEPGGTIGPNWKPAGGRPSASDVDPSAFISDAADAALGRLLRVSLLTLGVFAVLSLPLAWWMAGRVLRPVAVITATARRLSGETLHERLHLDAPPGELKELADTFDAMLDRMEHLVGAQRRFAANAAHELRTPLAVQRAAAEIGLRDADPARVARIREKLITVATDSQQLIEGLLLLATAEQGLERRTPVDLVDTAARTLADLREEADRRQVAITLTAPPEPVRVDADPVLVTHLVRNLLHNALRHNRPGGTVTVTVTPEGLRVTNTGDPVPPDLVPLLFEPFRRLREREHTPGAGAGLGLSIVAAITRAHGWRVTARAEPEGGLTVDVAVR
ncbi:sensor histidine kinase (plasmid) [Streptomyces sp. BI20]|uniref:sensor histidine kinase n=1 Tax=Streptomyces sp. BI20 TaxID=3403460 RepID=UPI003C783884